MRLGARENADQGILLAATTEHFLYYPASQVLHVGWNCEWNWRWWRPRACLKMTSARCALQFCGRFRLNEGGVAGYVNWMKAKYTANWGVQVVGMVFQTRSRDSDCNLLLTRKFLLSDAFRIYPFCNQSQAYRILGNIRLPVLSYQKSCVFQFEILVSYHCHTTIYLSYCLGAILSRASE